MASLILQTKALEICLRCRCDVIYFFGGGRPGNLMYVSRRVLGDVLIFAGRSPYKTDGRIVRVWYVVLLG